MFPLSLSSSNGVRVKGALLGGVAATFAMVAFGANAADAPSPDGAAAPQPPAPLGVFGVDMPAAGKAVFSFVPSFARSAGNLIGTNSVTPQYIVTNIPWIYATAPGEKLRLAPQSLSVESQGVSAAYGLANNVTVVAATSYVEKSVNMLTFAGTSGTTPLGTSVGDTQGIGDTTAATILRVYQDPNNQVHFNLGLSLPTGSTTGNIALLKPNGTEPSARAFYAMQIGTGTVDFLPGATYSGTMNAWSWGLSYRARLPLDYNAEGYKYGDLQEANAWGGYSWTPGFETTLRVDGVAQGRIDGSDPLIDGAAQGANPYFYGGQRVDIYGGAIVSGKYIGLDATQFAVEAGAPVYQNLNGPQIAREWQITAALRIKL